VTNDPLMNRTDPDRRQSQRHETGLPVRRNALNPGFHGVASRTEDPPQPRRPGLPRRGVLVRRDAATGRPGLPRRGVAAGGRRTNSSQKPRPS